MVVASITLLPALLGFAGLRLLRASLPWTRRREAVDAEGTSGSPASAPRPTAARPVAAVGRPRDRPPVALDDRRHRGAAAGGRPVLSMRLGQTDAGTNPPSTTTRKAYDLTAEGSAPGSTVRCCCRSS